MRCEHERDDAAYVLGALPPAEREAYERHLESCAICRASVAEVAGMPGLLARLDPARAQAMLPGHPTDDPVSGVAGPPPRAPETLLPRIMRAAAAEQRRNRRKARWRTAASAAVAACLALVIGAGIVTVLRDPAQQPPPQGPPTVAMVPLSATSRVGANISLVDHQWGTEIRMWCKYKGSPRASGGGDYPPRWRYTLVAITKDGEAVTLASWAIEAGGKEPEITATTEYRRDQLKQLELRRADGKALLYYEVS